MNQHDAGDEHEARDESRAEPARPLLGNPEVMAEVAFAQAQLTYLASDLGPEGATWPDPARLIPDQGLWLIDPGRDLASWRLVRLSSAGEIERDIDLVESLALASPHEFVPFALGSDVDLLASLEFDFEQQIQEDYARVHVSDTGEVQIERLEDFRFDGEVFILDEVVLNREGSGAQAAWYSYAPGTKKQRLSVASMGMPAAEVGGRVVECLSPNEFRVLKPGGEVGTVAVIGGTSTDGELVRGAGPFFGQIRLAPPVTRGDAEEQPRRLDLYYFDHAGPAVYALGARQLTPAVFSETDHGELVHFRAAQSCLDAAGNLYEIEWRPSGLRIQRYSNDIARATSRIEQLRDSASKR